MTYLERHYPKHPAVRRARIVKYTIRPENLDGRGARLTRVYAMPPHPDYWLAVTDVPCPICRGTIRWAEAGYVAGYRICDTCHRHFQADGDAEGPELLRVGRRRGGE